jgi:hypothetical protein
MVEARGKGTYLIERNKKVGGRMRSPREFSIVLLPYNERLLLEFTLTFDGRASQRVQYLSRLIL